MHSALPERDDSSDRRRLPCSPARSPDSRHDRRRARPHRHRWKSGWRATPPRSPPRRKCATASSTTSSAPGSSCLHAHRSGATPTVSTRSATICWCSTRRLPGPDHRRIVGTYRLLRQEIAAAAGGFYSEDEFELTDAVARHPGQRFLELGRSCVLPEYRSKRTIEVAVAGHLGLYQPLRHRRDDRLRLVPRHRAGGACRGAVLSRAITAAPSPDWDVRAVAGPLLLDGPDAGRGGQRQVGDRRACRR